MAKWVTCMQQNRFKKVLYSLFIYNIETTINNKQFPREVATVQIPLAITELVAHQWHSPGADPGLNEALLCKTLGDNADPIRIA